MVNLSVTGDILIFMPGQEDIEVTCDLISGVLNVLFDQGVRATMKSWVHP